MIEGSFVCAKRVTAPWALHVLCGDPFPQGWRPGLSSQAPSGRATMSVAPVLTNSTQRVDEVALYNQMSIDGTSACHQS